MQTIIHRLWVALFLVSSLRCVDKPGQQAANNPTTAKQPPAATSTDPGQPPEVVVGALYRAAAIGKSPFQANDSTAIAHYFSRDLTGLIWEDIQTMKKNGEIGLLDMDPLFNAQDISIRNFTVAMPTYSEPNRSAEVKVRFINLGKTETLRYQLVNEQGVWRIGDIIYQDGAQLVQMMSGKAENSL